MRKMIDEKLKRKKLSLPVWTDVVLNLDQSFITRISKTIDVTYAHAYNELTKLCDLGLAFKTVEGRIIHTHLTDDGEELRELLDRINIILDKYDPKQ